MINFIASIKVRAIVLLLLFLFVVTFFSYYGYSQYNNCNIDIEEERYIIKNFGLQANECLDSSHYKRFFKVKLKAKETDLNYTLTSHDKIQNHKSTILLIVGGPGSIVLDQFKNNNLGFFEKILFDINKNKINGGREILDYVATKCNSVIITPAYHGTYDVSNYPDQSIHSAVKDIEYISDHVKQISNNKPVIVITSSLGSYLYSITNKLQFDGHIALAPLVMSPDDFMSRVVNNTKKGGYEDALRQQWKKYRIGPDKKITEVRGVDFIRAFFGQTEYNKVDFIEGWKKQNKNDIFKKNMIMILGKEDVVAGRGDLFVPKLKEAGFNAHSLNFYNHILSTDDAELTYPLIDPMLDKICKN
jgi:hypothetical protein